ncbi:MAG: hypothetical protein H0U10_03860 [Chloroflexia bacterium]|nr:hypothetical protein [Chloroflexia bacterium]
MGAGYWIVVGLVAVALATVLLAVWRDAEMVAEKERGVWVVLAASDGTGHGLDDPSTAAWPHLLAETTPPSAARIANLSVGGLTLDRAITEALPELLRLRPQGVTIWLAVNDYGFGRPLAAYIVDLETLLAAVRATGAAVVVGNLPDLATVPYLAEASGDPAALRADCARWNAAIAAVASRYEATVVDFFPNPIDPETLGPDGFHPSAEGQRRLAERFRRAMPGM